MNEQLYGHYVLLSSAIRDSEHAIIASGVTEDELIDRAAHELTKVIKMHARKSDKIIFAIGGGNNGADGLESAEKLYSCGYSVVIMPVGSYRNATNKAKFQKLKDNGIKIVDSIECGVYAVAIDCIFGIGLNRAPIEEYARAINEINNSGSFIISADIPSGLVADNGCAYTPCVMANLTVTFIDLKAGLILGMGRNYVGDVIVADIGLKSKPIGNILSSADAMLPKRLPISHKGNYGKVRVIGGSETMPGAPLMCFESAVAALRSGAGLVTLCVPDSEKSAYQARVTEEMLYFLPSQSGKIYFNADSLRHATNGADSVVVGPGMGRNGEISKIIAWLIGNFSGTLVIDADGLNALATNPDMLLSKKCKIILTPHVAEFKRLCPVFDIEKPSIEVIKNFASHYGVVVAVKSATTVITDGNEVYFNITGTPSLAKGGSGDVLAGMVAAMACVLSPLSAVKAACFHFGLAGERASKRLASVTSVLASDIIIDIKYAE